MLNEESLNCFLIYPFTHMYSGGSGPQGKKIMRLAGSAHNFFRWVPEPPLYMCVTLNFDGLELFFVN